MTLLINNNPVDIQLQGERTAFEVIKQLDAWLAEQGHALIGLDIDGQAVELGSDSWRQTALESIHTMELEAPNLHQLRLANLGALNHYAETFNTALQDLAAGKNTISSIVQAITAYPDIRPALYYLAENLGPENENSCTLPQETDRIIQDCHTADGTFNSANLLALARQVTVLVVLSRDRINEASFPVREARTTATILMEVMTHLSMVSTNILTGKGKEAFDTILQFSELLGKLLRLFWLMVEIKSPDQAVPYSRDELRDWSLMVNQCLSQVSGAIDSQDTVLLGDLLEYELPQHIEKLVALIPMED